MFLNLILSSIYNIRTKHCHSGHLKRLYKGTKSFKALMFAESDSS